MADEKIKAMVTANGMKAVVMADGKMKGVVMGALEGVLLRDLADIVVEYSRRPGHKWITDPVWLAPHVIVSPDGHTATGGDEDRNTFAVRGCETFEFGARRWNICVSGSAWVGVVNLKGIGSTPPWLIPDHFKQHGYDYSEDQSFWFSLRPLTQYYTQYRGPAMSPLITVDIPCSNECHKHNIKFEAQVENNIIQVTFCGDQLPPMQVPNLRDFTPYAGAFSSITLTSDNE